MSQPNNNMVYCICSLFFFAHCTFLWFQLEALEKVFEQSQYPDVTVLETLAERMGLAIEKVCVSGGTRVAYFI